MQDDLFLGQVFDTGAQICIMSERIARQFARAGHGAIEQLARPFNLGGIYSATHRVTHGIRLDGIQYAISNTLAPSISAIWSPMQAMRHNQINFIIDNDGLWMGTDTLWRAGYRYEDRIYTPTKYVPTTCGAP